MVGDARRSWTEVDANRGLDLGSPEGPSAYHAYFRLQAAEDGSAELRVEKAGSVLVRLNGRVLTEEDGSFRLDVRPGSNDVLVRLVTSPGLDQPELLLRAPERVTATMPERLGLATLAERLKAGNAAGEAIPQVFLAVDWSQAVENGDPGRGRKLFGPDGLGCAKCHAITDTLAVDGGPSLAGARDRFTTAHIVESILLPGKQVAPIFRSTSIATGDGQIVTGLVVNETDSSVELLLSDATRRSIERDDIEVRKEQDTSPMPAGLVRSPDELRDLLAYILGTMPEIP